MSTKIKTIKNTGRFNDRDMDITRFAGRNGQMIQITQGFASSLNDLDEPGFIQITKQDAKELIQALKEVWK